MFIFGFAHIIIYMSLLAAIVFIAELVIATAILILIVNADKKVLALNAQVVHITPKVEEALYEFRSALRKVHGATDPFVCFIKRRRTANLVNLIKNAALTLISIFGKGKYKKIATLLSVLSAAGGYKNFLKKC